MITDHPHFTGLLTLLLTCATEWAVTGQVTPAAAGTETQLDPTLQAITAYRFGQSRKALFEVEKWVYAAATDAGRKQNLAARLATMLGSDATIDCKQFLCQQLSLVGGPAEVPALAPLLLNQDLAFAARSALERIPGEASLTALRAALGQATGPERIGLVNSLSARGDLKAVGAIASLVMGSDQAAAGAAIDALGQLGGPEALQALQAAQNAVPVGLRERLAQALLRCADRMVAAGQAAPAGEIYRQLNASGQTRPIRLAAFPGYLASAGEQGSTLLFETLAGPDTVMQAAALLALRRSENKNLLPKAADRLTKLPAALQVQLISLIVERHETAALPAITRAAAAEDPALRKAAFVALGRLGDASTVGVLVSLAEKANDEERRVIRGSLASLEGAGVDEALSGALSGASAVGQIELIQALVSRIVPAGVPALVQVLASPSAPVRREALKGLGELGEPSVCPRLIEFLGGSTDADQAAAEAALAAIGRRTGRVDSVIEALPRSGERQKTSLISVLGAVGSADALTAIRAQLQSENTSVRHAAVQVLGGWNDGAPLEDLLHVAESASDARSKLLALRGVGRLAPLAKDQPAERRLAVLVKALDLAERPEEKKTLLSALGSVPSFEAMEVAQAQLKNPATAEEAGLAVLQIAVQIADQIGSDQTTKTRAAIRQVLESVQTPAVNGRALAVLFKMDAARNLASGAMASSPDQIDADGQAGGDQAAIDGNPGTYWDEVDNQKLYRLQVKLKSPATVSAIRILGYAHQNYAPKDFEVICDGQVVQTVREAKYLDNHLEVPLSPTRCQTLELKITGSYGPSPAIRELQILGELGGP
jgi:HEAT repeat protein